MSKDSFSKIADELYNINRYATSIENDSADGVPNVEHVSELLGQIRFCTSRIKEAAEEIQKSIPASGRKTYDEIVEEWYEVRKKADLNNEACLPLSALMSKYETVFGIYQLKPSADAKA